MLNEHDFYEICYEIWNIEILNLYEIYLKFAGEIWNIAVILA